MYGLQISIRVFFKNVLLSVCTVGGQKFVQCIYITNTYVMTWTVYYIESVYYLLSSFSRVLRILHSSYVFERVPWALFKKFRQHFQYQKTVVGN